MIVEICSVVIAACALFVSVFTAYIQKKHDRISILPICFIVEKCHEGNLAVLIRNLGLGAMTIDKAMMTRGEEVHGNLIEMMPKVKQKWEGFSLEIEGRTILPTQEIVLIAINPKSESIRQAVKDALTGVEVSISFHDVYGKEYHKEKRLGESWKRILVMLQNKDRKAGPAFLNEKAGPASSNGIISLRSRRAGGRAFR